MPEDNDKKYIIIECPNKSCKCQLRIPDTDKSLRITCPKCETIFSYPQERMRTKQPSWFVKKIKDHPIFFGLIITLYLVLVADKYLMNAFFIEDMIFVTGICLVIWLAVSWILDRLIDKNIKWYYQKWFVLLLLLLLPPLGITLLWAGSKFSKPFKVILSLVFGSWFVLNFLTSAPRDFFTSPQDHIAELFYAQRGEIYLKPTGEQEAQKFRDFIVNTSSPLLSVLTGSQIYNQWNESIGVIIAIDNRDNIIGQGSGFVVSPDGVIVTNYHVVKSSYDVFIRFVNGKTYQETSLIVGYPSYDIAILKIEEDESFNYVYLGDSDEIQVGEPVLAIGSPYGLENTVSDGLISGRREIGDITLLQITAPISPGSSGGALFNMKGELIGITSIGSQWDAQNLNFAIPVNTLKYLIKENL